MCSICGCGGSDMAMPARSRKRREAPTALWRPVPAGDVTPAVAAAMPSAVAAETASVDMLRVERDILGKNDALAAANRGALAACGIFALNLVSSPGSGKTTLLCKTIEALHGAIPLAVIEGDQQTACDAERIRAAGAPAVQINTGKGCHLDAAMVGRALRQFDPPDRPDNGLLLIENVGNLVCPAPFDLGEDHKVVIFSVTEGEDKPLKYPDMFAAADLMLLNKVDLLPHLSFDVERATRYAQRINPALEVIALSATTGEGIDAWLAWIAAARARRLPAAQAV